MSASRAPRAAGAWGHLFLVVLALGVFAMHTVGHPDDDSGVSHGDTASAVPFGVASDASRASDAPAALLAPAESAERAEFAVPTGSTEPEGIADPTGSAGTAPSTVGHHHFQLPGTNPLSAAVPVTGAPVNTAAADDLSERATALSAAAGLPRLAGQGISASPGTHAFGALPSSPTGHDTAPAGNPLTASTPNPSAGHGAQAGVHQHGPTMDMASLCVAVLGSWVLVALLWGALAHGSDRLSHLCAGALTTVRPGTSPPRPDLAQLSVLRT